MMSTPDEMLRSVKMARQFLFDLMDPNETPRVPKSVRERARRILKHYPFDVHLEGVS